MTTGPLQEQVETVFRTLLGELLGTDNLDMSDFQGDPYDNGVRHIIERVLAAHDRSSPEEIPEEIPDENRDKIWARLRALRVLTSMDGKQLDAFRNRNGRKFRTKVTAEYIRSRPKGKLPPLHLAYKAHAGNGTMEDDWTSRYDGITLMGHLTFFQDQASRDAELHDPDTGERWPESEIQAVSYETALHHLLRARQRSGKKSPGRWDIMCGCEAACSHHHAAYAVLDEEYRRFLRWLDDRKRAGA